MYKDNKNKEESQNFWISYADLMAGLLFVFILLVGAIVIKYVFIQTDLQTIRADLQKEKEALGISEDALADKKKRLEDLQSQLRDKQQENFHLAFLLNEAQEKLKNSEDNNTNLSSFITTKLEEIALNQNEIQKLKDLLFEYELKEKELKNTNETLQNEIEKNTLTISLKAQEIAKLEDTLIIRSKEHQKLVDELNITKVKIQSLTGIRIKVVSKLKEKLGKSIDIDPQSGAVRFSSNILFEQNSFLLKEESKSELSGVLQKYINTLLFDDEIKNYIEQITIEGYTNSDGSYLYNLELSQKRALEVMKFLYEKYPDNTPLFREYISASGRGYANIILGKEGLEDKDASRRIEIKFRIKNEKAINELKNFLGR